MNVLAMLWLSLLQEMSKKGVLEMKDTAYEVKFLKLSGNRNIDMYFYPLKSNFGLLVWYIFYWPSKIY